MKPYLKITLTLFIIITIVLGFALPVNMPPGWYQQTLPRADVIIQDLFFIDTSKGWFAARNSSLDSSLIYATTNGGTNWNLQFIGPTYLTTIQFLDANTGYSVGIGPQGIKKTTNGGNNWFTVSTLSAVLLSDMVFVNKDTGWICSDDPIDGGIFRTVNGGINWQLQAPVGPYKPIKLSFINKDTGWACSNEPSGRLFRTTNGGMDWNLQYTFSTACRDIFFISKDTAWATGGTTGIMKTTNGGFNWFSQNNPGTVTNETKLFFLNNKRGWAGVFSNRMLATTDGGVNWGYQTTPAFTNFSVFFTDSLHGWGGTSILIRTTDGGGNIISGIEQVSGQIPKDYKLYQNYPNPFNPLTNIKYDIKKSANIKLLVCNITGEESELLVNQIQSAGTYKVDWNASGFASGIYLYALFVNGLLFGVKKMILLK